MITRLDRLSDRQILFALILYSVGLVGWLLAARARVTQEDGFYYFKIAQNVAQGLGPTFDGLNLTNGYHPLWLWCLVPIFWLTSSPITALQLGTLVQGMLMAAGAGLLYYTARLRFQRLAAILAALFWILLLNRVSLGGVEFSLHALGLIASAYVYLRWFSNGRLPSSSAHFGLGVLLSLMFLARLDTLLLIGVMGLFLMRREF